MEERNKRAKRRVFKIGCGVLLFLGICTVLSIRIQEMMRCEVMTVRGSRLSEAGCEEIPLSAVVWEDGMSRLYYIRQEEGIFEKEWIVYEKAVTVVAESDHSVSVLPEDVMADGKYVDIVYWSVYPVEVGESVERVKERREPLAQRQILGKYMGLLVFFILSLVISAGIWKKLCLFQERKWREGMKGVLMLLVYLAASYWWLAYIDIPREILPPGQIFDVRFYLRWGAEHVWPSLF